MSITNAEKAEILVQALPYIQKYNGDIIVIKYGGNAMINEELKRAVMGDVVLLNQIGIKVVLVHGGGPEISETLKKMGKETKFIGGLRQTDEETAEIVQMVLAGKINKNLVNLIENTGGKAMGLCGIDGHMIEARKLNDELGFVGEITGIDVKPVLDVLEMGYIPVISTVGYDKEGHVYNINADTAAAEIAVALKARNFILLTDTRGVLRDPHNESSLIPVIHTHEVAALKENGIVTGGMIPKVDCCVSAAERGIHRTFITDGRIRHSILIEMLSEEGCGTMFTK